MFIDRPLQRRQTDAGFRITGAENVYPVSILDFVLVCHLDDAPAEIEEVVAQLSRKGPSFEVIDFDRIVPLVALLGCVALQHIQEFGRTRDAVLLEEVQVAQRGIETIPE